VDSVGTKVMVAAMMNRHTTVGEDIVNHCVNDILVQGARPLFFMDYIAASDLTETTVSSSLSAGCKSRLRARRRTRSARMCEEGGTISSVSSPASLGTRRGRPSPRRVLGLASNGLHTNGYSLARKLFFEVAGLPVDQHIPQLGRTIGDELLRVHRCYAPAVLPLLEEVDVKGMAHITGGGLPDNLVRALPAGCRAVVNRRSWEPPAIFQLIQELGRVTDEEMYHTFNMGVGLVLVVESEAEAAAPASARARRCTALACGGGGALGAHSVRGEG
jgi:phosphoribosylformylglycinamidine cyclo-ligase